MGEITQESHFEMLEKLPDGNYKAKYPKVKSKSGVTFDEHLAEKASFKTIGHTKYSDFIQIGQGSDIIYSDSELKSTTSGQYAILKTYTTNLDGVYRVRHNMKSSQAANIYSRVTKNGVIVGPERVNYYEHFNEFAIDVNCIAGDILALELKTDGRPHTASSNLFTIEGSYTIKKNII